MIAIPLQIHILLNIRLKTLLEVIDLQFFALPEYLRTSGVLGRNQNIRDDLDDTIVGHTVVNGDTREAIDPDRDKGSVACNVDSKVLVRQHGREVIVVVRRTTLGGNLVLLCSIKESISIQRLVNNDVVLEQSLEVLLAVL